MEFITNEGLLVAFDFDDTIVESDYPEIGRPKPFAIETLKTLKDIGIRIAIWTCREDLSPIKEWLDRWHIEVDAINDNSALTEEEFDNFNQHDSRKVAADIYIDDRNLNHIDDLRYIRDRLIKIYKAREENQ